MQKNSVLQSERRLKMNNGTLKVVKGDATTPQFTTPNEIAIIPHVCNNMGGWGAGFVMALSRKWKKPEEVYRNFCKMKPLPLLGKTCYAQMMHENIIIANMIGQAGTVSDDNPTPIKYKALANCMEDVFGYVEMMKTQSEKPVVIHCPKFGSDLAGGKWDFILELIREIWLEQGIDVVVYEFE